MSAHGVTLIRAFEENGIKMTSNAESSVFCGTVFCSPYVVITYKSWVYIYIYHIHVPVQGNWKPFSLASEY
jgi:predicted membrane-bound spermidine synthase